MNPGRCLAPEVVAVHPHVHTADRHRVPPNPGQESGQSRRQVDSSALDADQNHLGARFIALGDFVGDAGEGAFHGCCV